MTQRLTDKERLDWWRLMRSDQVGPITFFRLIDQYGTAGRALDMLPELSRRGGRKEPLVPFPIAEAERELARLDKAGARVIAACEADYPILLTSVDDAPPVITVRGNPGLWADRTCIAMVGARNASLSGRKMSEILARDLGRANYVVVSGLARGIDTAAHEGSLASGTVAVVAGGPDVIYPPENAKLYAQIVEQGAIISEHPAGFEPKAQHFPRRNRIISGMSAGTVVVEASLKSGSLITARCALEQGRDVFAVPGSPLDPRAQGPNQLIRDGAVLVEQAEHITGHLSLFRSRPNLAETPPSTYLSQARDPDPSELQAARKTILSALSPVSVQVDELIRSCQLSTHVVQTIVLELELAGRIDRQPGNRIALIQKD